MVREIIDQTGYEVRFNFPPKKIISLVPSQTELLSDLGLDEEIAGITRFCIHPERIFRTKPRVGGTKTINFQKIDEIKPDLIIANKEENQKEQILALREKYPVYTTEIYTLSGSMSMIMALGEITGKEEKSASISKEILKGFELLEKKRDNKNPLKTVYMIWKGPWMAAGKNTFIDDILARCNFLNVFKDQDGRYPSFELKELIKYEPDLFILSSEPYPFKQKHIEEILKTFPDSKVITADGEMFSWYGSRLLKAPEYICRLIIDMNL